MLLLYLVPYSKAAMFIENSVCLTVSMGFIGPSSNKVTFHHTRLRSPTVASILFEIWGSRIRSKKFSIRAEKISDFPDKFLVFQAKISDDLMFSPQLKKFLFFS